jgi:hypothetical protein
MGGAWIAETGRYTPKMAVIQNKKTEGIQDEDHCNVDRVFAWL